MKSSRLRKLDHLIEELAQGDPSLPEVRLLQDLQRAQKVHERIVTRATERVWQRLLTNERSNETVERDAHSIPSIPPQSLTKNTRKGFLKTNNFDKPATRPERRSHRLFAEVAAVLLVGILVSMFAILFQFYHTHTGNHATQQPPPMERTQTASLPASLYATWTGGVVKLDKQSGKVLWVFHVPDSQLLQSSFSGFSEIPKITISTENTIYLTNSSINTSTTKTNTFTLHEYAINAQSGSLRWSYTSQGDQASGDSVISGDTLYLAANTGITMQTTEGNGQAYNIPTGSSLLALDTRNGHLLWRTQLKGSGAENLAVNNGFAYVSISSGGLNRTPIYGIEALNAQSGTAAWWALTPGTVISQSPLQVTGTLVYDITMASDTHNGNQTITVVHAFDSLNGKERWSSTPIVGIIITGVTPVLSNGVIYFCANFGSEANNTGKIFALDAASGKQLQAHSLPLELYQLLPIDGHIYLSYASHSGPDPSIYQTYGSEGLLALNTTTYHQLWLNSKLSDFPDNLLLGNGLLYFMTINDQTEAVNQDTGTIIWQQDLSKYINLA